MASEPSSFRWLKSKSSDAGGSQLRHIHHHMYDENVGAGAGQQYI